MGATGDDFFMTIAVASAPPGSLLEFDLRYIGDIHDTDETWEVYLRRNPIARLGDCRNGGCVFFGGTSVGAEDHTVAFVTAEDFNSAIFEGSIVLGWVNGGGVGPNVGSVHRAEVRINFS